jgi:hypothetical protein
MREAKRQILELSVAACLLAIGVIGCGSTTSSDVAYEDAYAGDYYYPADVGYAGLYGAGFGYYGLYFATPQTGLATAALPVDGGLADAGLTGAAAARAGTARRSPAPPPCGARSERRSGTSRSAARSVRAR